VSCPDGLADYVDSLIVLASACLDDAGRLHVCALSCCVERGLDLLDLVVCLAQPSLGISSPPGAMAVVAAVYVKMFVSVNYVRFRWEQAID
jgi:hypothetical protein